VQPLIGQTIVVLLVESEPKTFPGDVGPVGLMVTFNVAGPVTFPVREIGVIRFAASFVVIVSVAVNVPETPAGGLKFTKSSPVFPGDT
jgi:hypothetical protein